MKRLFALVALALLIPAAGCSSCRNGLLDGGLFDGGLFGRDACETECCGPTTSGYADFDQVEGLEGVEVIPQPYAPGPR